MAGTTNSVLLDREHRLVSRQEVKAPIADNVNARLKRASERVEPQAAAEFAAVTHHVKQKSVRETSETEREPGRGRTTARISQIVDYLFYLIYGLITLQFLVRLIAAPPGNGFTHFVASAARLLIAPLEGLVPTPSNGPYRIERSYLLAPLVYISLHLAINVVFRLIAHRKVTVSYRKVTV